LNNRRDKQHSIFAWAAYDWANSAFATAVIAGFFPLFFKDYWSSGVDATVSSFRLGAANSAASLLVIFIAPVLGAIADQGGYKRRFLFALALLGILATAGLYLLQAGQWQAAIALYVVGGLGFAGANVFYDALLVDVSPRDRLEQVSALGYALGYLGGGLFFAVAVCMTLKPHWFGLASAEYAVRLTFLGVAVWWLLFSLPLLKWVQERPGAGIAAGAAVNAGFKQLRETFIKVRRYRAVWTMLIAYWLYIDGVDTIIRMAVDYGRSLGFTADKLIVALLITQFIGFPSALAFGWLGQRIGAKQGIFIGLIVYVGITVWAYFLDSIVEFYSIAIVIGLVQGGVQSLSRALYARLVPADAAAEFFGFYNLLGKFAAILGPLMMGWVGLVSGSTRVSILSLLILFAGGAYLLARVPEPKIIDSVRPSTY
jgi:UMF1 family MFS transporter